MASLLANQDMHLLWMAIGGTAGVMAGAAKILLIAARTMPPPKDSCGFAYRWAYDFFQQAFENQDKVGKVQDPNQPVGVEKPQVSASAVVSNIPPGVAADAVK